MKLQKESGSGIKKKSKYFLLILGMAIFIFFFSIFMIAVTNQRNDISRTNYINVSRVYNGELNQDAPKLLTQEDYSNFQSSSDQNQQQQQELIDFPTTSQELNITSTDAEVVVDADFVKKGLQYQPTFETQFAADYILENNSEEESEVVFTFPFPFSTDRNEISNVTLVVDGEEVESPKVKLQSYRNSSQEGVQWKGTIPANSEKNISVTYDTVGIGSINYTGFENPNGQQDFNFQVTINGTRGYDVDSGLSVDRREFGDNSVTLTWEKSDLFAEPRIDVDITNKISPQEQISRIYFVMSGIFVAFAGALVFFSKKKGKLIRLKDLLIVSVLFTIYFPLLHYLASFTVDPTIDVFSGLNNIGYFSMPLWGAFAISLLLTGGLISYLLSSIYGRGFTLKTVIPLIVMFLGFFPLVVTIPEYSVLLILIGIIALIALLIQVRLGEK
jgi:hypothetical protein